MLIIVIMLFSRVTQMRLLSESKVIRVYLGYKHYLRYIIQPLCTI